MEREPGAAKVLEKQLRVSNQPRDDDGPVYKHVEKYLSAKLTDTVKSFVNWFKARAPNQNHPDEEDGMPNVVQPQAAQQLGRIGPNETLYLLLAIQKGEHEVRLHQERIDHINDDARLFHFLRKKYQEHRQHSVISFRKVVKVLVKKVCTRMRIMCRRAGALNFFFRRATSLRSTPISLST